MRGPRLSVLLVLLVTAVIAASVGVVSYSASRILGRIAEDEALATARVAAAAVVEGLQREEDRLLSAADRLAERPALRSLLLEGDPARVAEFLQSFGELFHIETCAAVRGAEVVALAGPAPAADLLAARGEGRMGTALRIDEETGRARLAAFAEVYELPGNKALAAGAVDIGAFSAANSHVRLRLLSRETIGSGGFVARSPLWESALLAGESASRVISTEKALVAVAPLRSGDTIIGLVEAEIPRASAVTVRKQWVRGVRRIALVVLSLAVLGAILIGRRLATPIEGLARTANRIGLGDLETPVTAEAGGELGTLATAMDEMRLRLLEAGRQLQQRQAESEAVLSGIVEGVFAVDGERRIRFLNSRAALLLGVDTRRAIGRFCGDVLRPEGPDGIRPCEESCPILDARAQGRASAVEHLAPEGRPPVTVIVTSAPPAGQRQIQLLREETGAEATRRLRDTVVANISHEFRTPLAAQIASIEMLRDRLGDIDPAEARRLVLAMERGALRLARLIDNLLESVRLDSGERSIRRVPVALDEVVEEAAEAMRPLLDQREQRLQIDLPHPLPGVMGDAPRLVQVLVNLFANANKFAPAGSAIRVSGAVEPGWVMLSVEDEGPGLPEGDDEILFGRFVRRAGEEPEESGIGLGLWIARSIVERHGGRIWSAPSKGGARLCVVLPEAPVEGPGRG
jgi:signal transduction histidine kinase/HAMP domain-containing protein